MLEVSETNNQTAVTVGKEESFGASCQVERVPTRDMIEKVAIGNYYDYDKGYGAFASGYEVHVQLTNGDTLYCKYMNDANGRSHYDWRHSEPEKPLSGASELDDLSDKMKESLFGELISSYFDKDIDRKVLENAKNIFVYGEEDGTRINEKNAWADKLGPRDIVFRAQADLTDGAEVTKVDYIKSVSRWPGTGYTNYIYVVTASDGTQLQVTKIANCGGIQSPFYDEYKVESYDKIKEEQKKFGRHAAELAKKAGVPWNIAVFATGVMDDKEAVSVLKSIKQEAARFSKNGELKETLHELLECGIGRRTSAIERVIGEELFRKLSCSGQRATTILAAYLAGRIQGPSGYKPGKE